MRVCQIGVISFPPKKENAEKAIIGGISGYTEDLIEYLLLHNYEVDFVGQIQNYYPKKKLTYYEIQKRRSSTNKFLINLFFKSIRIKLDPNTIVHAHRPDHLAVFSWFRKNKSVLTLHGQQAITVYKRKNLLIRIIFRNLEKIAFSKAKLILVTDQITKEYYLSKYPKFSENIFINSTFVDTNKFKPLDIVKCREKFNIYVTDKVILYLGRIEPPKKVKEIILAFNILAKENKNFKLLLVGSGVELDNNIKLCKKLKIENRVTFLGAIERDYLPEIINCANVSVLVSGNEGSPMSVKESLACGVPVVANCVGDIESLVKSGFNGYLLQEINIHEIASKLSKAILDSDNLRANCVQSIKEYSHEIVLKKMDRFYEKASRSR